MAMGRGYNAQSKQRNSETAVVRPKWWFGCDKSRGEITLSQHFKFSMMLDLTTQIYPVYNITRFSSTPAYKALATRLKLFEIFFQIFLKINFFGWNIFWCLLHIYLNRAEHTFRFRTHSTCLSNGECLPWKVRLYMQDSKNAHRSLSGNSVNRTSASPDSYLPYFWYQRILWC